MNAQTCLLLSLVFLSHGLVESKKCACDPELQVHASMSSTIKCFGHRKANPKIHQYMSLVINIDQYLVCAGTLIRPNWVLTAGYCLVRKCLASKIQVLVDPYRNVSLEQSLRYVDGIPYIHPMYSYNADTSITKNDIGLLKLQQHFYDIRYAQLTKIDCGSCDSVNQVSWAIADREYLPETNNLRLTFHTQIIYEEIQCIFDTLQMRQQEFVICRSMHSLAQQVCADCPETRHRPCFGDVGGPILCNGLQYGLITAKPQHETYEGISYTMWPKVSTYFNWIISIIENRCYDPSGTEDEMEEICVKFKSS